MYLALHLRHHLLSAAFAQVLVALQWLLANELLCWDAGDFADLGALTALKRTHDFLLVVDDAHGTLVCGPR